MCEMLQTSKLQTDKGEAAIVTGADAASAFVVVCEHAGLAIPEGLGDLGMSAGELHSHVAWDPGAAEVAQLLAQELDGTLVKQRYSRLVYDCNRPPSSSEAMRDVSEDTQIPANRNLSQEEKRWRTQHIYSAFHDVVGDYLNRRAAPILVTVHSFTPVYHGVRRSVDVGILHDEDARLADAVLLSAQFDEGISVQRNEPYGPQDGVTHTLKLHSQDRQILNVMIEIKNDLIADESSQRHYAHQLAETIKQAVGSINAADTADEQG